MWTWRTAEGRFIAISKTRARKNLMGLLYRPVRQAGFPFSFAEKIVHAGYDVCIETGTYKGQTALELTKLFKRVYTIEASEIYYKENERKFSETNAVTAIFGDTRNELPAILQKEAQAKIVFWLDAHYSETDSFFNDPPILAELRAINASGIVDPVIIVDDARFILRVNNGVRYCDIHDFISVFYNNNRYISCIEDKFIAVPVALSGVLDDYTDSVSSEDWQYYMFASGGYSIGQKAAEICKRLARKWLPPTVVSGLKKLRASKLFLPHVNS